MFNTNFYTHVSDSNESMDRFMDNLNNIDYHTFYRAYVIDNADSMKLGRVKIRIPSMHGFNSSNANYVDNSVLPWATPAIFNSAGNDTGSFLIPNVGDVVLVTFEENNKELPIYFGGIPSKIGDNTKNLSSSKINGNKKYIVNDDDLIKDIKHGTERVVYKSLKGSTIIVDDYDGEEYLKIIDQSGQTIEMQNYDDSLNRRGDKVGLSTKSKITITNNQGDKITLKNNQTYIKSNSIVVETEKIEIPGVNRDFSLEASIVDLINGSEVIAYNSDTDSNAIKYQKMIDKIIGIEEFSASDKKIINKALELLKDINEDDYIDSKQTDYSSNMITKAIAYSININGEN